MMKTYLFMLITMAVTALGCNLNQGRQSITVKSNNEGYWFTATYPESKTKDLVSYVKENLKDDNFFDDDNGVKYNKNVIANGAKFIINSSPGSIEISFKKRDNSETSYQELIDLCTGIKETLQ